MIFRVSSAHEEAGDRVYAVSTQEFLGDDDGGVRALRLVEVDASFQPVEGTEREIPAQLVLLAMGFTGSAARGPGRAARASSSTSAATIARDASYASSVDGVFVAGDAGRGQSLIVWAIAEGRAAAAAVDRYLTGETSLPRPDPAHRAAAGGLSRQAAGPGVRPVQSRRPRQASTAPEASWVRVTGDRAEARVSSWRSLTLVLAVLGRAVSGLRRQQPPGRRALRRGRRPAPPSRASRRRTSHRRSGTGSQGCRPVIDNDVYSQTRAGMLAARVRRDPALPLRARTHRAPRSP